MGTIRVRSNQREEMVEITRKIAEEIDTSPASEGVCTIFVRHTTCGITINENADPDVQHDILLFLKQLIPQHYKGFRHFEHNSDSHIKSSLMGSSVSVPIEEGKLVLGRWQGIYMCEFDGPRNREVVVQISAK